MTTTTNLGITLIDTNQSQKEVTANAAILALEEAATEWLAFEVEDGANAVASADVRENQLLILTAGSPGPSAAFDVELPALKRMLAIRNDAGYTATIACAGAATGAAESVIEDGKAALVFCTGSEVLTITADATSLVSAFTDLSDTPANYTGAGGYALEVNAGATEVVFSPKPYDIGAYVPGVPTASQVVARIPAVRAFTLPASLTDSQGKAIVAATATTDFDIQKNGSSIGTMSFAAAATSATFTFPSAISFAAGDILAVVAPATPDATLAGVSFVFAGMRT